MKSYRLQHVHVALANGQAAKIRSVENLSWAQWGCQCDEQASGTDQALQAKCAQSDFTPLMKR